MTFDDLVSPADVFVDANTFIYHFTSGPKWGAACTRLLERIEFQEHRGFLSTHVLADVVHRLMTTEAMDRLGWPATRLASRLRQHHAEIPNLTIYLQALTKIAQIGIQVLPILGLHVHQAAQLSRAHELLTGDALVVAVMQANGLTNLASLDTDFDRVSGITRYATLDRRR